MNEDPHSLPDAPHAGRQAWRAFGGAGEAPLRAQVFSAAQMAVHGRQLAAHHALSRRQGKHGLRARLLDNAAVLARAGAALTRAAKAGEALTPVAAGLLEHYHLIDEQVRAAHHALLQDHGRRLPCLVAPFDGAARPRVYQLALEVVAHGDGRVEPESLARFIASYQEGAPLLLDELRAFPDMLRAALVENLRRLVVRLERGRAQRRLARGWAERMLAMAESRPGDLVLLVADMARAVHPMGAPFVAELARRLQGGGAALGQVLQWVGARLADEGLSVEQQVRIDSEAQAADAVSAANSIDGLRLAGTHDWTAFIQAIWGPEQVLRQDPAGIHERMDEATRATYREALAGLARRTRHGEAEVAGEALTLASQAPREGGRDGRSRHIGYYLVGEGAALLRARLQGSRRAPADLLPGMRALARRQPLSVYLGAAGILTLLFVAALLVHAYRGGAGPGLLLALGVLGACGAAELALALVNGAAARLARPRPLPRMDFAGGIPDDARTLVTLPALLHAGVDVAALGEALETHYLTNRDPNLRFCLLADLADAPAQGMPEDAALVERVRAAIADLNRRHGDGDRPFLLLLRPRVWSESEGAWIGRARRFGQLADLNAFLRGGARERFQLVEGDAAGLAALRYVLVVDAATRPSHDAVRVLVATMAHPLNQPLFDAAGTHVVAGHGLLQAQLVSALPGDAATRYERRCARLRGADTAAQDWFGSAPFGGQGLYDVDSFQRVLGQGLPEAALLAYELAAGTALRCAQVADAVFDAPVPARYSDDVARRHRTARAAWQLAASARALPCMASLGRWMLFDRLRRSLVTPSLVALLVPCWALLPEPAFWSAAVLSVFFLPAFAGVLAALADKPGDMLWHQHIDNWSRDARAALGQAVMSTAFLPHEAWTSLDALARAGWRTLVSGKRLGEWRSPSLVRSGADMEANWHGMWFAPLFAVGSAVLLTFLHPFALFASAPLLLLWFLSPVLAWWVSQPKVQRSSPLSASQLRFLARLARRTWGYFESAVGPASNWLAPAAVQAHPRPMVIERIAPSDIGYGLLASLAAWDFGFVSQSELLVRVRAAFDSMDLLERHRGHFHAAYESGTLAPLRPARVATLESGILAAHLLTLAEGLEALADAPIATTRALEGIRATLEVLDELAQAQAETAPAGLREAIAHCHAQLLPEHCRNTDTLPGLADCLQGAAGAAQALLAALPEEADPQLRDWATRLDSGCDAALADLLALAPWMRAVQEYVLDASLTRIPTLRELAAAQRAPDGADDALARMMVEGVHTARARLEDIAALTRRARAFADMDFGLLYRPDSRLLARGFDVAEERLDSASCAWLASEARLASLVGIACGALPVAHWYALRRPLCVLDGEQLLQSEDGALSDYLAPLLVLPAWRDTLLDQSCRAVVRAQIAYARRYDTPWGMSASGCNTVDHAMQYAWRVFGVPGTGVRRGLADDLVIAPYAGMLALMVEPEAACANLERLAALGCIGEHGFYDALDYTGARLPPGQKHALVRAWVTRHQGMGLLSLSSLLHERPMARRFASDARVRAALPLLQERVPRTGAFEAPGFELDAAHIAPPQTPLPTRVVRRPGASQPQVQLLSNGRYHVMLTSDGGGYSRRDGLALTRWRGEAAGVDGGLFCYLRDLDSGALWSSAWQPTLAEAERYEVVFSEGSVQLRRRDHGIALVMQVAVSPEDDIELRRLCLRNLTDRPRRIELTSYCEVALTAAAGDGGPMPRSQTFAESEVLAGQHALLCTRRSLVPGEEAPWMLHLMAGSSWGDASFETSRSRFIGPGASLALPAALTGASDGSAGTLSGTGGLVPDPVMAIRRVLVLAPGAEATVDLVLGAAPSRETAVELVMQYRQSGHADRVFELAWIRGQALLRHLNASEADSQLYGGLAGALLYPNRALRADPAVVARNQRDATSLWMQGLSGELPIVLAHVRSEAGLELARQLLAAHAWWRLNGLGADLVIWYGDDAGYKAGYRQDLHQQIMTLVAAQLGAEALDRPGGVFVRTIASLANEDRIMLQAAACLVLFDEHGSLAEQLRRAVPAAAAPLLPFAHLDADANLDAGALPAPLQFDNGIGGFSPDGREYLVRSGPGGAPQTPWTNLLANPGFGSLVRHDGTAHTWSGHAGDGRLTPALADCLLGQGGEAFYVRDEDSGAVWSPAPLPAPSGGHYLTRHGFGYSVFEHGGHGIHTEMTSFVALDAPLKYTLLRVRNDGAAPRRLSATGYVEWVLGGQRAQALLDGSHVVTARDPGSGALCARTAWNAGWSGQACFFHVDGEPAAFTCDRMEFLGRGRDLARPAGFGQARLSGAHGAGLDPCAALQVVFTLQPGEQKELVFLLGVGAQDDVGALVQRHGGALAAAVALERVRGYWNDTLGALRVETPDPAVDVLANGWLMYQTIAGMWTGSGAQPGAGVVFATVLQDAMATVQLVPQLLRARLLDCAAHQYVEGDVQAWWQPPSQRGLRTRSASDHLWLPLAVCRYVQHTGDFAVLNERVPYLEGRALEAGETVHLDLPGQSGQVGDLYDHCVRALRHALRVGPHGLPLIEGGDWLPGVAGNADEERGESVWLGFLLAGVLRDFAQVAERRADYGFALTCRAAAQALATQLEQHGWDGAWYRCGLRGDGSVLGTGDNTACRIDAATQSWAVLSQVAEPERAAAALAALDAHLVRRDARLVQLLDPPADAHEAGSIGVSPPGTGANGGGSTQAGIWAAMAHARLGQGTRAWALLDLLNPLRRSATPEDAARYACEPYVLAGSVCYAPPSIGRGDQGWYTGSAGWMYRLIVESLLGLERVGERLVLAPLLPPDWPGFRMHYRYRGTPYEIEVCAAEAPALLVDGQPVEGSTVQLVDDGVPHRVELHVVRPQDAALAANLEANQSKSMP